MKTKLLTFRSRDPGVSAGMLTGLIWVHCPRCAKPAVVRHSGNWSTGYETKLRCGHCGFAHDHAQTFVATRARSAMVSRWAPRCDRCGKPMEDRSGQVATRRGTALTMRIRCLGCNHVSTFPAIAMVKGSDGFDPVFGLPLILVEQIGSNLLWAYNGEHIAMLQAWLGASLRERHRGPQFMTMMARLPYWMKAARSRPAIVVALARLRVRAEALS